ncbi:Transposon TX1 uncharacterized 82 kDa protein ORF 1 [Collichthys lucidus]|uniref:Transposon TX1 uncharacterized 82 kDa protein ORF 1 n=1 Tax=Collichthys lucidus TaxID=240159 RepID=A0A4U5TXB5_COLLU|nr:Transposon TX1 uncharacterized 82 kDa protein ORF 1 [Collichthys lucidus]
MNKAVVLFLEKVEQVNMLVETGITVNGLFEPVLPLTQPATRITLSNVPPFISDEFLIKELSRHGKVISPIKKMLSGCKSPLLRHVVSHRRQLFMILNNKAEEFNYRFIVRVEDCDYVLFATSSAAKCFGCGEEGHLANACPSRASPAAPSKASGAAGAAGRPVPAARRQPGGEVSEAGGGTGKGSENKDMTGEVGENRDATGEGSESGRETGEAGGIGEEGKGPGEVGESTKEMGEVGGAGEAGKVSGEVCEGSAQAENVVMGTGVSEAAPVPAKRRSKRKNVSGAGGGSKAGRLEGQPTAADSSDSDGWVSDCSEVLTDSQEKKLYSEKMLKLFLQKTKGVKGLDLEQHFPDQLTFYYSARHVLRNRATSELTDQEIFRLKKQLVKVRKQIKF